MKNYLKDMCHAFNECKLTTTKETIASSRETWSSRTAFILASIGAAVGFGNVWRFPALAYDYGGGAFFIPYIFALLFVGIPLLLLEIALGQFHQAGDVGVFGSIHMRLRGIGLSSIMCGFFVTVYYVPLISWVVRGFVESFTPEMRVEWDEISGAQAVSYFYDEVIGMSTLGNDNKPTRLVFANVFYLLLTWAIIGGCVAFGIKWTGRIAYFTMGLPIVLLFVFLCRAVTLPGASEGIKAYIGNWDMSVLIDRPDIWSTAVSQIFFSLGVTFGVMTAFGSHCPRKSPAVENSIIIAVSNSLFSFISGFAVFGSLGYLKFYEGAQTLDQVVRSGPSLLFGAYPSVLSTLPGGIWWVRLLFFNLFLLGIDSAFALTEAVLTVVKESAIGSKLPKRHIVGGTIALGFLLGMIYMTDAGLIFLDTIDFYINFIMILIGFGKSFSAGWIYGLEEQIAVLGPKPVYAYMITTFGSTTLASLVWFGIKAETTVWGFMTLILSYGGGIAYIKHLLEEKIKAEPEKNWTLESIRYELTLRNVNNLKDSLGDCVGTIPAIWAILIKHVIPPVLLILFFNLANAETNEYKPEFGHYNGYPAWPYQVLGVLVVLLACAVVIVGVVKPQLYECLSFSSEEVEETIVYEDVEDGTSYRREEDVSHAEVEDEKEASSYVELKEQKTTATGTLERSDSDEYVEIKGDAVSPQSSDEFVKIPDDIPGDSTLP